MSIITFPLNNTDYTADAMALYCSNRTNGVFSADTELSVLSNNNMTVTVKPGRAWINFSTFKGYIFGSDSDITLNVGIADGILNRIDRVVIKYDVVANVSSIYIKRGEVNSNPIPPTLTRDTTIAYELAIADIYIAKGITAITPTNITDKRLDTSVCGLVSDGINKIATDVLNNQFQDWFKNLQNQLDSNQASNLQNQINGIKTDTDTWNDFRDKGGYIGGSVISRGHLRADIEDSRVYATDFLRDTPLTAIPSSLFATFGIVNSTGNENITLRVGKSVTGEPLVYPRENGSYLLGNKTFAFKDVFTSARSIGITGYSKGTNEMIEQWGLVNISPNTPTKINFPTTFPTTACVVSLAMSGTTGSSPAPVFSALTNSSVTVAHTAQVSVQIHWRVNGY